MLQSVVGNNMRSSMSLISHLVVPRTEHQPCVHLPSPLRARSLPTLDCLEDTPRRRPAPPTTRRRGSISKSFQRRQPCAGVRRRSRCAYRLLLLQANWLFSAGQAQASIHVRFLYLKPVTCTAYRRSPSPLPLLIQWCSPCEAKARRSPSWC